MSTRTPTVYVAADGIARRLGVKRNTVHHGASRSANGRGFPAPARRYGNVPVWDWDEVKAWAASTGRPYREGDE